MRLSEDGSTEYHPSLSIPCRHSRARAEFFDSPSPGFQSGFGGSEVVPSLSSLAHAAGRPDGDAQTHFHIMSEKRKRKRSEGIPSSLLSEGVLNCEVSHEVSNVRHRFRLRRYSACSQDKPLRGPR
jgi:hypothetical protein